MNRLMLVAATILLLTGSAVLGAATASESSGGEAKGGKIELVRIKPIIFQIPGPGGLRRSIGVTIALELANSRYRDQVVSKLPKIKARIFEAWTARPLVRSGDENFDPEEIKRRVRRVSDNMFGEGIVSGVLIEAINEVLIR